VVITERKARPIIFSGDMVRALLDGRKTMTRRVIKPQPEGPPLTHILGTRWASACDIDGLIRENRDCPYGVPGDLLYVRETWRALNRFNSQVVAPASHVVFEAGRQYGELVAEGGRMGERRPSIHMPRWASRITLKLTDVRVERVQEISDDDCIAEGIGQRWTCLNPGIGSYAHDNDVLDDYRKLWNSLNGKRPGASWDDNPWCWCLSFTVHQCNVGEMSCSP
jgi:hypothetical protein